MTKQKLQREVFDAFDAFGEIINIEASDGALLKKVYFDGHGILAALANVVILVNACYSGLLIHWLMMESALSRMKNLLLIKLINNQILFLFSASARCPCGGFLFCGR